MTKSVGGKSLTNKLKKHKIVYSLSTIIRENEVLHGKKKKPHILE
jgi:hypothetical protein